MTEGSERTYRKVTLDVFLNCTLGGFAEAVETRYRTGRGGTLNWSSSEDQTLVKLREQNVGFKLIAERLGRTQGTAVVRMCYLRKKAQSMALGGGSPETVTAKP